MGIARSIQKRLFIGAVLIFLTTMIFDPWRLENTSGDTISARYWPVAILKFDTFKLNPFIGDLGGVAHAAINHDGDKIVRNGIAMAIFTVPFYWVADAFDWYGGIWDTERINHVSRLNAIFIGIASILLLYFLLMRLFDDERVALTSSAIFAFGTWNFSFGVQGLTSQATAVLIHFLILHCFLSLCRAEKARGHLIWTVALAILHGTLLGIRPQDILLALPMLLVFRVRRTLTAYTLVFLALALPIIWINVTYYGHASGYLGVLADDARRLGWGQWNVNFLPGFFTLLFSPNRGAILFFPFLLLTPWLTKASRPVSVWKYWKGVLKSAPDSFGPDSYLTLLSTGAALYFAMLCCYYLWHGGWAYGPRYLYDLEPYLWPAIALLVKDVLTWMKTKSRPRIRLLHAIALLFTLESIFVHALGHRNFDIYVWHYERGTEVTHAKAWNFDYTLLGETWKAGSNRYRWPSAADRLRNYGF